jgi:small nuclear ribonucleoprotein (snRNP)-like protein
MPDTFAITIALIILSTIVVAFFRGRSKDKCLMDFSKDMVTLEKRNGKIIWGKLRVENTGLELIYSTRYKNENGHLETSYILYKNEYPDIQALIRYYDELSEEDKREREEELKKVYHPTALRRGRRRIRNFFNMVKDSVLEVANLLLGRAQRMVPAGGMLLSKDKYTSRIKQQFVSFLGGSFEPLLERHIGKKVVLQLTRGDKIFEYPGVLKEYTAEFIQVMDVEYKMKEEQLSRKADLIVPRAYGIIRHLGE